MRSTASWPGRLLARQPHRAGLLHGAGPGRRAPRTGSASSPPRPRTGSLRGLLHFVPWGSDGLSLDLMRRDRSAQPGVNDFLIVEAIKAAHALGVKRISLNFAVFRAALERGERIGAGPVLRIWRRFLIFISRWFQIESLYKFNAKFCPVWEPRFFVFPGTGDAVRVGVAALEAEAFLVWPRLELRRLARKLGLARARRRLRRVLYRARPPRRPRLTANLAAAPRRPGRPSPPAPPRRAATPVARPPDLALGPSLAHGSGGGVPAGVALGNDPLAA